MGRRDLLFHVWLQRAFSRRFDDINEGHVFVFFIAEGVVRTISKEGIDQVSIGLPPGFDVLGFSQPGPAQTRLDQKPN